MALAVLEAIYQGSMFRIEEDNPDVGAYLYLYEDGRCIKDHLQDNVEKCRQSAFEMYGVPVDIWKQK